MVLCEELLLLFVLSGFYPQPQLVFPCTHTDKLSTKYWRGPYTDLLGYLYSSLSLSSTLPYYEFQSPWSPWTLASCPQLKGSAQFLLLCAMCWKCPQSSNLGQAVLSAYMFSFVPPQLLLHSYLRDVS